MAGGKQVTPTDQTRLEQIRNGANWPGNVAFLLSLLSQETKRADEAEAGTAETEILEKSVAAMNLAAAYLWKAADAVGASHPSDPCVFHAQRLQIASGAIHRMLTVRRGREGKI